jgi:hypothetical protein
MTGWTPRTERHIPEDELHAYLDQALSRSQGAEIETHLSACTVCQARRAGVAAQRDRTTALLSQLTPRPVIIPPSFQDLRERNRHILTLALWKARVRRAGIWAAGVAAAVGAGWIARSALDPHQAASGFLAQQPGSPTDEQSAPADAGLSVSLAAPALATPPGSAPATLVSDSFDLDQRATPAPLPEGPAPRTRRAESRNAVAVSPAPQFQLASFEVPVALTEREADPEPSRTSVEAPSSPFGRIIRVFAWEEALQIAGSNLPFIEGMPVVAVLFDPGAPGERPAVMVTQQDPGGEFVYSIEGPEARVAALIQRQSSPELKASELARTPPDYVEGAGGELRRSLRILRVVGRLPVDSLNTLARKVALR